MANGWMARILSLALGLGVLLLSDFGSAATQKSGFPMQIFGSGWARTSRPVLANLGFGGASDKAIIFGTSGPLPAKEWAGVPTGGGSLYAILPDGTTVPGFPKSFPAEVNTPAAQDVDGDGKADIFVGYRSAYNAPTGYPGGGYPGGGVRAYLSRDGYKDSAPGGGTWNRPGLDFSGSLKCGVFSTPAVADVDGDGRYEVAWGGFDGWLYLVDAKTGEDKPGWPIYVKDSVWASPAVFDLNGDGKMEIIFGVDSHYELIQVNGGGGTLIDMWVPFGGCIWAFQPDGTIMPNFPYCVGQVIYSSPAVGDINGDGKPEIVFGTGEYTHDCLNPNFKEYKMTHQLFAITADGKDVSGWPVNLDADEEVGTSPALGDVDGDGMLEVVVTTFRTPETGCPNPSPSTNSVQSRLLVYRGNGALLAALPIFSSSPVPTSSANGGDPILADIGGADGRPEILIPYEWEAAVFGYATSSSSAISQLTTSGTFQYGTTGPGIAVAVGNLDSTPEAEVVMLTSGHHLTPDPNETAVNVWSTKQSSTIPWGFFHQDAARTGVIYSASMPAPQIQLSTPSLNFGYVTRGSFKNLTLEVKNIGTGTLTGVATTIAPFSIISGGSYSLGSNESQVVTIQYMPTSPGAHGTHTGTVVFTGGYGATASVAGKTPLGLPWMQLLLEN